MPFMRFCTVPALCLAVALAACAPATKSAPPASGKTASGKAATTTPPSGQQQGFRVVMGKPLPGTPSQGTPINQTPAAPPQAQQIPAQTAPPPQVMAEPAQPQAAPIPMPPLPAQGQAMTPPAAAPADAAATASGQPTGFGGLTFGDTPQAQPGLAVYDAEAGDVITYVWPKGPTDVFGAPVREAFYEFYQNRFYHVWINFDGMAAYKKALAGLTSAFGPPTKEVPEKYYHAWTLGDVNIYCAFHPAENGGDVSLFYQPIYEPMMAAAHAKAAKTGKTPKAAPKGKKP